jgi:phage terminase large subunit
VYIQEATEEGVTFDLYETLLRLLRNGRMPYHQIMMDCNPTTPTHWLYKRSQPGGMLKRYQSKHQDNPRFYDRVAQQWTTAGEEYLSTLRRMTGARKARFYEGEWKAAEGLVYDGYVAEPTPKGHILQPGWKAPNDWRRVWGIDWGFTAPLSLGIWALDGDGRMYLTRELYVTRWRVDRVAKWARMMLDSGQEPKPVAIVCDHDPEAAATFEAVSNLTVEMADKTDRDKGIQQVQRRFDFAGDDRPRIFFSESARWNEAESELIAAGKPTSGVEELIGYKWKQDADKDEPEETNDHFCDQMRYVTRYLENNEGIGDAIRDANRANAGRTMTDRLPAGTFRKHRR